MNLFPVTENPINCDCDQQELWSWLKDHKKIIPEEDILRCNMPLNLKGQSFLDLEPQKFCSSFGEIKMSVRDVQPFSMLVSWVSNLNQSTIRGYRIAYQAIDVDGQVRDFLLDPASERDFRKFRVHSHIKLVIPTYVITLRFSNLTKHLPLHS